MTDLIEFDPVDDIGAGAFGDPGQRTFVIPTHDLVVVRMGHYRGDRSGMKALNSALAELIAAVPVS